MINIEGDYNSTDSTFKISVRVFGSSSDVISYHYTFTHLPSFPLNQWIYIGMSFSRQKTIEDYYDFHIVSKTLSGFEDSTSFTSQILDKL